ncbi:HNH endonuclease [Mesonia aquimarina]|uniref:HNH endonuclease n=1 Tax=Mesonia aquimarina TaxID=1504967 RepID=UPI000EF5828B|nr:HNH endonuclease [Mesonia aquimarina]
MQEPINKYIAQLTQLNRDYSKGLGKAPHKPVLLISVIELIAKQEITGNRIFITGELVLAFKNNWKKLVTTGHTANFALPFFHLRSEPFWELVTKPGKQIPLTKSRSIKSFPKLKETLAFATIDQALFQLLQQPVHRELLLAVLLDTYFPETKHNFSFALPNTTQQQLEYEILNEPSAIYKQHIIELKASLPEDDYQEELFIRGSLFKKTIPKLYDYSCCISKMKVETGLNIQLIDACHIHPISLSYDATIQNGLALTPTLHRAFDRGLITITTDFTVRVSKRLHEGASVYALSQFEGTTIQLPQQVHHYPSLEALAWHRKAVFLL